MKFIRQEPGDVAAYLSKLISGYLSQSKKVLWLLSGGSSVEVAVEARKQLPNQNLKNLTVMLTDERYGPIGHNESNWQKLKVAGFDFSEIEDIPVLCGKTATQTTEDFEENLKRELAESDVKIGITGIGADGHTSGILIDSPALKAPGLATYYRGPDFMRITTTPRCLLMLDQAVVNLSGEEKQAIVDRLQEEISYAEMPAQILKKIPNFVVFNDWIGGKL